MENRFKKINSNRRFYKPETCGKRPLVGFCLGVEKMPDAKDQQTGKPKAWYAFVFETTAPTNVVDGADEVGETKVGEQVYLPMNADLRKAILPRFIAAEKIGQMVEFSIEPVKKQSIGKGRQLWIFETGHDPSTARKRPADVPAFYDNSAPLALLGDGAAAADAAGADDALARVEEQDLDDVFP